MHVKYTGLWNWKKKILFDDDMLKFYQSEFEDINIHDDYHFFFLDRKQFQWFFKHNILNYVSFQKLDRTYQNSQELQTYYDVLFEFIQKNQITHVVIMHTWQYRHPDFLKKLKNIWVVLALWTADDDSNTIKYCSLPYTKYYDYHFHVWVMFDAKKTIADILKEHGSKNPLWVPLWAMQIHINNNIDFEHRDIEVCYIGNVNPLKLFRLSKLKRHFGDRFKLYGAQGNGDWKSIKWIFYKIVNRLFSIWYVQKLSDEELTQVYARTKIWFNMHLVSYKWPSNMRLYELPMNWVMQLCDNEKWLHKTFVVGKEIIAYKNISDAIQKIEYYLKHDKERIEIAKAWYTRAKWKYTCENNFRKVLSTIFEN